MNVMTIIDVFGELNSIPVNTLALNDMGGDAEIVMDLMGMGEAFPPLLIVDFPSIVPRVCVPAETNVAKVGC